MVLLSRVLIYKYNRYSNIIACLIKILLMIVTLFMGTATSYYMFITYKEIFSTLYIMHKFGLSRKNRTHICFFRFNLY